MADVLTQGQQQIISSALSGPIEISGTSPATTCSECDNLRLDSALKQAKKDVITPEPALLIW